MPSPRISPGTRSEIGRMNELIARFLGVAAGTGPPNLFTTLARHRRLFRPWLRFAGALMPGGLLPRIDSELVILRVAHITGCTYEWGHHERLAEVAGLGADQVQAVRDGPDGPGFSPRQRLLLRAVDELHADRTISDTVWAELRPELSDPELIELCMLTGHYEMLAMTLNALAVAPDAQPAGRPPLATRLIQSVIARRR
jgi:AhpD family alkylhydroperoxidase